MTHKHCMEVKRTSNEGRTEVKQMSDEKARQQNSIQDVKMQYGRAHGIGR